MANLIIYSLPEHLRLEVQAVHLSAMMNDKVLHAPIKDHGGLRTLDIGCGTGIVTEMMSEAWPHAECIGLDLSKVPELRPHSNNIRYFQGNATTQKPTDWVPNDGRAKLPEDRETFDYVFSRLLILGMAHWPKYIKTEFNLLRPGGWVEVHDLDWDWFDRNDNIISKNWDWLSRLEEKLEGEKDLDFHCGSRAQKWMKDAGFTNIQVFEYYWPFGGESEPTIEGREFGLYTTVAFPSMMHHMIQRSMADEPPSEEQQQLVERMRAEMRWNVLPEKGKHQIFRVTIGQKPE